MRKIKRNAARCKLCGDIIESTHRHDFVTCSCGNVSVDGGHDYLRRGWMDDKATWEDMNEFAPDVETYYAAGPGWWKLLDKELKEFYDIDPKVTIDEVKEKYGEARVHYTPGTPNRYDLLAMQEEILARASRETCDLCGAYGTVRSENGWLQCLCDRCYAADRRERGMIAAKTAEEYRNTIDHILSSVAGSMALSDMPLTEKDKAYIRYAVWFPDEIEKTVKNLTGSHSREE